MEGCLLCNWQGLNNWLTVQKIKEKIKHFKNNFLLDQNQNRAKQNKTKKLHKQTKKYLCKNICNWFVSCIKFLEVHKKMTTQLKNDERRGIGSLHIGSIT